MTFLDSAQQTLDGPGELASAQRVDEARIEAVDDTLRTGRPLGVLALLRNDLHCPLARLPPVQCLLVLHLATALEQRKSPQVELREQLIFPGAQVAGTGHGRVTAG